MFASIPGGQFMIGPSQGSRTLNLFVSAINAPEPQSRTVRNAIKASDLLTPLLGGRNSRLQHELIPPP
jgi:hypothetical protein